MSYDVYVRYIYIFLDCLYILFVDYYLPRIKYLDPKYQVPYFIDPNTGIKTGNYKQILSHIFETYSTATQ